MQILKAYQLASVLHAGQVDKAGRPYIEHLTRVFVRVVAAGGDVHQQIAALLHDSIEDGKATKQELLEHGVSAESIDLVIVLSKPDGVTYMDYLEGVKKVEKAVLVKLADLEDNSDPERLANLPEDVASRLRKKYSKAEDFFRSQR